MDPKLLFKEDIFFDRFIKKTLGFRELNPGDKIVIGVSGGLDSIVLLHLLNATKQYDLFIAHVNHNLRVKSNNDQYFVEKLSRKLEIPFFLKSLKLSSLKKGQSIEEWGREKRYSFFNDILIKVKAKWIMTAHHGNDQIETLLFNLSRKTGVAGLRGISKKRDNILRPLIDFSKNEMREFSGRFGLAYVQDESNNDYSIPRNYLRKKVIEPWEIQNKNIVSSINSSINIFKEWYEALDSLISIFLYPKIINLRYEFKIPIDLFTTVPRIVQLRLIQKLINSKNEFRFSKHHYKMLSQFLMKKKLGSIYNLFECWDLAFEREFLIGYKKNILNFDEIKVLRLNNPFVTRDTTFEITLDKSKIHYNKENILSHESINWSVIKNKVIKIRLWRNGDQFIPLGMDGQQKISDFLINQKIELSQKRVQYVTTADNCIFWVCGRRISNLVKIENDTKEKAYLIQRSIN